MRTAFCVSPIPTLSSSLPSKGFARSSRINRKRVVMVDGQGSKAGETTKKGSGSSQTAPVYCQRCAAPMELKTPPGDERVRQVCTECKWVQYENPKVVVASVPMSFDKKRVLLARRAIPPKGAWTIPAGFLELEEDAQDAAAREAWEECRARLKMPGVLLAVYSILPASQVQLVYASTVLNEDTLEPGIESQAVKMFSWEHIPWDELAFPTVRWALEHAQNNLHSTCILPQLRTRHIDGTYTETASTA